MIIIVILIIIVITVAIIIINMIIVNDSLTEPEVNCQVLTIDTSLFTAFHLQQRSIIL